MRPLSRAAWAAQVGFRVSWDSKAGVVGSLLTAKYCGDTKPDRRNTTRLKPIESKFQSSQTTSPEQGHAPPLGRTPLVLMMRALWGLPQRINNSQTMTCRWAVWLEKMEGSAYAFMVGAEDGLGAQGTWEEVHRAQRQRPPASAETSGLSLPIGS